ncbi:uncharacterized protein MELLADRAFT_67528 [Melampsora larici-populina 98AG31]|uniref:Uncharacterized protein n=1 Tax=Melampsora larici-populina (strain 98AG31 / pathotype 3-4-7) TaxID=747676 RepID=F4S3G5_MELLP|nr:uncharacterized protein MELLADRAFT_67528 [Melampsora larici-populina 98AG31]EGG00807.1 hypothetical protein MELLADRAFT_67528 [Melampsora larici-populina 98AG31]
MDLAWILMPNRLRVTRSECTYCESYENPRNFGRGRVDAPLRCYHSQERLTNRLASVSVFEIKGHSKQFKMIENSKDIANRDRSYWSTKKLQGHLERLELFGTYARKLYDDQYFLSMMNSLNLILNGESTDSLPLECDLIGQAVDFFEQTDTNLIQKIWVLGLVQRFQMYHPTIDVLSTGSSDGQRIALSRLGLALSLTQRMNLWDPLITSVTFNSAIWIPTDLKKALKRVDLLHHVGKLNQETNQTSQSIFFKEVYDDLLQASCPFEPKKANSLAERCIEGIKIREEKTVEEESMDYISSHLYTFSKSAKNYIKKSLGSQFDSSKKMIKKHFEDIEHQRVRTLKRNQIQHYLQESPDPFIANLLKPFTDEVPVNLDHYKYILDCFEALKTIKYDLDIHRVHDPSSYSSDRRFVISVLYSESPYITGAGNYLASRFRTGNYLLHIAMSNISLGIC